MINVLVADDHTMFREGLKQLLAGSAEVAIRGEACDGEELLGLMDTTPCDVVLLDMTMPGRSGISLIRELRRRHPGVRLLVLSMHEEQQYIVEALKSGADGYVTKNSACDQLLLGIRRIAAGEQFISAAASQGLIRQLCAAKEEAPHLRLSYRERQVLDLLVAGHSVSDIARRLKISIKTASTHKTNMLEKMGLNSTADLIRYAVAHDLTS